MHLFDHSNVSATQSSFYITIVLAAVLTYVAALAAVWAAAPKDQRNGLQKQFSAPKEWWQRLKRKQIQEEKKKDEV